MTLLPHAEPRSLRPRSTRLPCFVQLATDAADLRAVAELRASAYGRRLPALAARLQCLEPADVLPRSRVLLARCRSSGRPLGTVRLQDRADGALLFEGSLAMPTDLQPLRTAEVARLCIERAAPPEVRPALIKAVWLLAAAVSVDWLLVVARGALVRVYERLGCRDLTPGGGEVPMRHIADLPHRLLGIDLRTATHAFRTSGHRLREFLLDTVHVDIRVGAAGPPPTGENSTLLRVTA